MRASVVIPAYNAAPWIRAAVESALQQTERDIEVLVIDDCSTDVTAQIVRDMAEQHSNVRLLRTASNGGPAVAEAPN